MASATYYPQVQKLYIAFYQRPADPGGLNYWATVIDQAGGQLTAATNAFAQSAEASALYGSITLANISGVIDAIYQAILNRAPDAAGKAFYVAGFLAGTFTPVSIALNVLNGATGTDAITLQNKLLVGNLFTQAVDGHALTDPAFAQGVAAATYAGAAAAVSARTLLGGVGSDAATVLGSAQITTLLQQQFAVPGDAVLANGAGRVTALSTGTDNLVGTSGNDFFIADNTGISKATSPQDTLTGGGGNDVLKVFSAKTAVPALDALPILNGLQTVDIVGANYRGLTLDVSGVAGLASLILESMPQTWAPASAAFFSPVASTGVTLGAGQTLTLSSLVPNVPGGGSAVAGTTNNVGVGFVTNVNSAAAVSGVNLVLSNVVAGSHLGSDGNTYQDTNAVSIGGTGVSSLSVQSTGSANAINLYDPGNALAALNLTGSKAFSVGYFAGQGVLASVNASAATGPTSVTLSSGNLLGAASVATSFAYAGGAGNDSLDLYNVTVNGTPLSAATLNQMRFDGGAGVNTLLLPSAAVEGTTPLTSLINIQVIGDDFAGGAGGLINMANFAGATGLRLAYANQGPVTVNNLASGGSFDEGSSLQGGNAITVNAAGSGTSDSLNWTLGTAVAAFGGASGTAKTSINGFETVNLVVQGGSATLTSGLTSVVLNPSPGGSEVLNISLGASLVLGGAGSLTLGGTNGATNGGTLKVSGPGSLTVSVGLVAGSLVDTGSGAVVANGANAVGLADFSGASGPVQFNDGNATSGVQLKGGSGGAVLVGSAFNDSISLGSGTNAVTGGAGADSIAISHGGLHNVTRLNYSALAQADTGAGLLANGVLSGVDVVTGAAAGDQINTNLTSLVSLSNALSGAFGASVAANNAFSVRGSYNLGNGAFSASASGADTLLEWTDAVGGNGHSNAIVLVGYAGSVASAVNAGLITLG